MPRAGWVKPVSDRRLSDLVSVGVLTRVFPPALVDEVIAEAGRTELSSRTLPARVMAYFAIGMGLYSQGSYEDVLSQLTDGLSWASGWEDTFTLPSRSVGARRRRWHWPSRCSTGWNRAWCSWPTGASTPTRCGAARPRPERTCSGEPRRACAPRIWRPSRTVRGWPRSDRRTTRTPSRSRYGCSTTPWTTAARTPGPTGCSPRSWIPARPRPRTSPRPTANVGRSSWPSTSSRPTNADHARYCAPKPLTWYYRRYGGTCAATTPSGP